MILEILANSRGMMHDFDAEPLQMRCMQMVLGTLNNIVINRPGPLDLSDDATSKELSQAAIRYLGWKNKPKRP